MPAKVTAAEVGAVILHPLHAVRVSAAAAARAAAQAAVQAEAVREVHRVQAVARVSVRGAERVIAQDRVQVARNAVIPPAKVTAAREVNTHRVRAAEMIRRYPSPARAPVVLRVSITTQPPLRPGNSRRANLISQNTRIRKIRGCGMILIGAERRR
jgi:hypothetical protein